MLFISRICRFSLVTSMRLLLRFPRVIFSRVVPATRSVAPRGKARTSVAWGVLFFVISQLGLGVASEIHPRIRDPLYGDKFAKLDRKLAANPGAKTVVMLGSSRTGLAFHGKRVEEAIAAQGHTTVAFNFGIPASGPVTHLIYLRRLLDSGVVPDLILIEILPSMLMETTDGPLERLWFFPDRITLRECDTLIGHGFQPGPVRESHAKSVLFPAFSLRFQLLTRVAPSWVPWQYRFDWSRSADECGWGTPLLQTISPADRQKAEAQARAEYANVLADLRPGGGATTALCEILELCRERGIRVKIVLMPEGSTFQSMYSAQSLERLKAFLSPLGTPIVDARNWLTDDVFTDGHHMFRVGAEQFTDRLTREVILPTFREGNP